MKKSQKYRLGSILCTQSMCRKIQFFCKPLENRGALSINLDYFLSYWTLDLKVSPKAEQEKVSKDDSINQSINQSCCTKLSSKQRRKEPGRRLQGREEQNQEQAYSCATHWGRFASQGFFSIHRSDPVRNQFDDQFEHIKVFGGGFNRDR